MATNAQILASLKRSAPFLQTQIHDEIAKGLIDDGLVNADSGEIRAAAASRLRTINAASADPVVATQLRRVVSFAAHRGVKVPLDKLIDADDLDRQLAGKDVQDRILIKNHLFLAGCLPA